MSNEEQRPSLADIANAASVAKSTVSKALNNSPEISQEVRNKIRLLAKTMGYMPNPTVNALMAQVSMRRRTRGIHGILALIEGASRDAPVDAFSVAPEMVAGAEARSHELGFLPARFSLYRNGMNPNRLRGILSARGIKCLVFLPFLEAAHILEMDISDFSCSTIGYSLRRPVVSRAVVANYHNTLLALEALRLDGCERIGYVSTRSLNDRMFGERLGAYCAFQYMLPEKRRLPPCILQEESPKANVSILKKYLKSETPKMVLVDAYSSTKLIAATAPQIQIECPHFAHLSITDETRGISGIDPCFGQIGGLAVDMAVAQMHRNECGEPATPRVSTVVGKWYDHANKLSHEQLQKHFETQLLADLGGHL